MACLSFYTPNHIVEVNDAFFDTSPPEGALGMRGKPLS